MNVRYWTRKLHRWIGIAVAIQLIAWTAGGLYFSLIPIEEIRGEHLLHEPEAVDVDQWSRVVKPSAVIEQLGDSDISDMRLIESRGRLEYRLSTAEQPLIFDAVTGKARLPVTQSEAETIAIKALIPDASITEIQLITEVPRGHEYRGRPLPAYQIDFDHDSGIRLYVDQNTGDITARRTDRWRIFDFFWMLHVMDYQDRTDFNHVLLTLAASIALFVLLTGVLMWWQTTALRHRRHYSRKIIE